MDTVTLIYFLERHPTFYHPAKRFFQLVERGEISAIVSSLVFSELLVPAFRANEQRRANTIVRVLSNFPNLTVLPMTTPISIAAARLRALHGLRTPDAIHAATAVEGGATGMITNDKHFLKLVESDFDVWLFKKGGP
ncbi:type II toxin-antitoxin system VapC family toxin [Desulfosarcina ovata]|nr:PIN domain-containing protein [Desulfosarcina ovata]